VRRVAVEDLALAREQREAGDDRAGQRCQLLAGLLVDVAEHAARRADEASERVQYRLAVGAVADRATWGGREYAWASAEIAGVAGAAVLLAAAFVARERSAPEPLLPLRLFREPAFVVVSAALSLATLAFFAVIVFMPIYLQVVEGASATGSGLLLLPMLLAGLASTTLAGRAISRTGRDKLFPVAGLALMSAGLLGLSRLGVGTPLATAGLVLAVFGVGFGMVTQVLTIAIQNAVERRDLGIATASANLFRALGGSFGVALFGSVFASRLGTGPEHLQGVAPGEVSNALHTVFLIGAPVALLGLLVILTLREVPLRTA
jgi:predicted MFS family arabinose efflux permease